MSLDQALFTRLALETLSGVIERTRLSWHAGCAWRISGRT